MSNRTCSRRLGRTAVVLAVVSAFAAIPAAAQAATTPVDLGTAKPFVALGGQAVTNSGQPSTLYGDLGVSPGTNLSMGSSVINGVTHNNDSVAAQAQLDLTGAYNTAAGETPFTDLSNQDLGNVGILPAGNYRYTSDAQLTGTLTLDGGGDPNAQFVFQIGSQLTTASASRVQLINGASACNVYWQMGTSAVLGSTTDFNGNLMALASVSLDDAATVTGRVLARNGSVTLIHNTLDARPCNTVTSTPPGTTPGAGTPGSGGSTPATTTLRPFVRPTAQTSRGTAIIRRTSPRPTGRNSCTDGFTAQVRGRRIKRVTFSLDGKRISSRRKSPFKVSVKARPGSHRIGARVTFTDATRAKRVSLRYRACSAAALQPRRGPARFTG
jgi:hypothetical protein